MNRRDVETEPHDSRLVEAAAWSTRLHEMGAQTCEAFEAWLAADARNEAAWRQMRGPWDLFEDHATAPELIAARRAALGRTQAAGRKRWRSRVLHGSTLRYALAASVLLATLGALFSWPLMQGEVYRTQIGEQRVVTLSDGSRISLDSGSEVRARYTPERRDLIMARGQVLFDVAHDAQRPFSVLVAEQRIIALGTSFNVDLTGESLRVTLIEGRVTVLDQRSSPEVEKADGSNGSVPSDVRQATRGIELAAGQQLAVAEDTRLEVATVNLERATAWQEGRLVFEDEPLSTVITRVNRYTRRPVRIEDPRTAQLRISGVFNTGDIEGFVATLTDYLPVQAQHGEDGSILLMPR